MEIKITSGSGAELIVGEDGSVKTPFRDAKFTPIEFRLLIQIYIKTFGLSIVPVTTEHIVEGKSSEVDE